MRNYIKLMRPQHYIKNGLLFLPALFAGTVFNGEILSKLFWGTLALSLIASTVYIVNDIKDCDKDRMHEVKKNRPIASGKVSPKNATMFAMILLLLGEAILHLASGAFFGRANMVVWIYLLCNLGYSFGLKNKPIMDVLLLASGFVLRTLLGAELADVAVSQWFVLAIMMFSLYMGFGKRRNELKKVQTNSTRAVLKFYTYNFLNRHMMICLTLGLAFYAYWCAEIANNKHMILTMPIVLALVMKYELNMENDSFGDPVDVLLSDKGLMALAGVYAIVVVGLMYYC